MNGKFDQVMVDLETLDTRPTAVIRTIGAVWFGADGIGAEFYVRIDPQSALDAGLTLGMDTVQWWLKQGDEARAEMCQPGVHLDEALQKFSEFMHGGPAGAAGPAGVWGNGPAFDNAILANAYAVTRRPLPWKFWFDRCFRTLCATAPEVRLLRVGTHHNALDDAKTQAAHVCEIWAYWKRVKAFNEVANAQGATLKAGVIGGVVK